MFDKLRGIKKQTGKSLKPFKKNSWMAGAIILAIAASQLTLFWKPAVGIYINAMAFALLVGLALWQKTARQLAISVAILPVATMISLSLPETTAFAQIMVFYDAILVLGLIYRFVFTLDYPLKNTSLKASGYLLAVPLMLVIGQLLGAVGYGLLRNQYGYGDTPLPLVAAAAVVFAIAEETLFRGLIQQRGSQVLNPVIAGAMTAILYALFTFGHTGSWLTPLFGLIMGTTLAVIYYKKQNLILTISVNAAAKLTYVGLMATFIFR